MRKNSIKNTRVNAEVQRELSNILRAGIKDPRVAPMTSVVAVEVAPDLKTCKAYISVLGDEKAQQDTIRGLQRRLYPPRTGTYDQYAKYTGNPVYRRSVNRIWCEYQ